MIQSPIATIDCYSIVIFGIRLAVYAVRNRDKSDYEYGILPLVAGAPKLDSREVLGALAIFENCGKQLNVDFRTHLNFLLSNSRKTRFQSTVEGYFSRSDEMRKVEVMGFTQIGSGQDFAFESKRFG